jgi:hypothetical protein
MRTGGVLGGEPSEVDRAEESIRLAGGGVLRGVLPGSRRLWSAELITPVPLLGWLIEHGDPIRYRRPLRPWPPPGPTVAG